MRILVLASDNPSPPINGTRIRNFHLWPIVRKMGHEVKILSLTRNAADLRESNEEIEFFCFTRQPLLQRILKRLLYSYHQHPVSQTLQERVKELEREWKPDIIHAEELRMGHYLPASSLAKLSVCVHNVESDLIRKTLAAPFSFAIGLFNRIYFWNLRRFEKKVFSKAKTILTYSALDRKRYQELFPERHFELSSNGVNALELSEPEKTLGPARQILFLGSLSYLPNIEGLFWLIDEILPRLQNKVQLTVAGSTPSELVKEKLKQSQIPLLDTPLDLRPIYLSHSLLLVPLLSGSGTRGKILESLMYQRPVLTTSKGVEGLDLNEGEGILLADGAEDFARKIDSWITMANAQRDSLAFRGREAVLQQYTWNTVAENLLAVWKKT